MTKRPDVTGAPEGRMDELRDELLTRRPGFRREWEASAPKRSLALALARLRTHAGRTQSQVAQAAGWDKAFVSRLESASGPLPDTATLTRYAAACGSALGLVFAEVGAEHARVIEAVTLAAPTQEHPFERLRGEDWALEDAAELKGRG